MAYHLTEWCAFFLFLNCTIMELQKLFEKTSPSELARIREKMQEASTRDKKRLLKKVIEIEKIVLDLGFKIELKEISKII